MEQTLINAAAGQGIWTLLSVVLLIYVIRDSKLRETKLMDHLEKTNESHEKIASSMERLEIRMEQIEKRVGKEY